MRFFQVTLSFLVFLMVALSISVFAQNGNAEAVIANEGIKISPNTGIALGTVVVLIGAISGLAFRAGHNMRRQEDLEKRVARLEKEVESFERVAG